MNPLDTSQEVPNTFSKLDDLWGTAMQVWNYKEYLISLDQFLESLIPRTLPWVEVIDSGISTVRARIQKLLFQYRHTIVIPFNELDIIFHIENIKALLLPGWYALVTLSIVRTDTAEILWGNLFDDTIL